MAQRGAFGGTVLRSDRAGGSWTSRPWYGTELALVFTVGLQGSNADVHVDGRRVATVSTYDPRTKQRQTRYLLRGLSPDTPHTVTVVNRPRDPPPHPARSRRVRRHVDTVRGRNFCRLRGSSA